MFDRIAVVDPGEPALRLIRAVRELDAEHGTRTRGSRWTPGPSAGRRSSGPPTRRVSRADAVRVGWGSLAEDPAFAELCADLGVTVAGPPPEATRLPGAEIEAEVPAEEAEFEAVHDTERARRVGSVHDVVPAAELRSRLTTAAERGTERAGAT